MPHSRENYGNGEAIMAEFEETRFFTVKVEKENETRDIILKYTMPLRKRA